MSVRMGRRVFGYAGVAPRHAAERRILRFASAFLASVMVMCVCVASAFPASADAIARDGSASGVKLPADWDATMAKYFPDEVLREAVDLEVRSEFAGQDLSSESVDDVLADVTGPYDNGHWDLYSTYEKACEKLGTSERIKSLNGIQYLQSLTLIDTADQVPGRRNKGVGLQMLAFPGIAQPTHDQWEAGQHEYAPDLMIRNEVLHVFPAKLYPDTSKDEVNIPVSTTNQNIGLSQNYYHHTPALTYVRDGSGGKRVTFEAGIYSIPDNASYDTNDESEDLVPIFDKSNNQMPQYNFNTIAGLTGYDTNNRDGFTVTTDDKEADKGQLVKVVGYHKAVSSFDSGHHMDIYSFSYAYEMTLDYLSTVKQQSMITTLGDFTFKKTSDTNPNLGLGGAQYRVMRDGKYLLGTVDGSTGTASVDENGQLATTDDPSQAMTITTGADGTISVKGVPATRDGVDYQVKEISAPTGYQTAAKPVTVKVKVSSDLKTQVTGGEPDEQTITADAVTASAADSSNWVNAGSSTRLPRGQQNPNAKKDTIDYAKSGDEMTMSSDGAGDAQSTKKPSDYNHGADKFIKNGGKTIGLAITSDDGGALPSGYKVVSQQSTLTDGTGTTLQTGTGSDSLTTVADAVNGIINGHKMSKVTDYYNVDTDAVYHDTTSANLNTFTVSDDGTGDVNVQRDSVKPVAVTINASKTLTSGTDAGQQITGDELTGFTFSLEPASDTDTATTNPPEGYAAEAHPDASGNVRWNLNFTSDWWKKATANVAACHVGEDGKATSGDGCTVTLNYEVSEQHDDNDPTYQYDDSKHKVRIEVSETATSDGSATGTTKARGLTAKVYVDNTLAGTAAYTDETADAIPTVTIPGDKLPFHNIKKTIDFGFTKTNAYTGAELKGATFTLYHATDACDATCQAAPVDTSKLPSKQWTVTGDPQTSDDNGTVRFADLAAGHYRLVETKVPDGYVQVHGQWNIVADPAADDSKGQLTITAVDGVQSPAFATGDTGYSVGNTPQQNVPSTGGRGLMAYTVIGVALMGSGVWAARRRSHRPAAPAATMSA